MKEKTVYRAKSGARYNDEMAGVIGAWVEKQGRCASAPQLIEDAKPEGSKLHGLFPWDDAKAAYQHRLWLAREHLNHLEIVIHRDRQDEVRTRATHNLTITTGDGESERAYFPVKVIMEEPKLREQVIAQALSELIRWKERYSQYKELFGIAKAIDKAMDGLNGATNGKTKHKRNVMVGSN